ncbi:putative N-acetylmannosamine-6-phosphate 2-epimerase [Sinorhizobium mexicanum]|uniref:Putative N-acetylmannosamine-6-phosphate 2-epimerase n=1 Tax=Sinorhizobium mexicanum TaxID=375549 RepID=A0A859R3P4_9HYPH|nr:putative N-acetylmannosamine-6-phosphate 2-epimerase [Sinorhizobium mexicanum]MBP1884654.1 N-acetylmannosamine-6-phosphate 2-epimerase/N-acetylmannosamine kinase [Sinorhizobium mexicanum]QLL65551.1 ROK family protein [Sinorhizobium mexicanum]
MQREDIRNGLIVSCQPVPAGPMDNAEFVTGFAKAAIDAGARALRIESVAYVRAVRSAVTVPIIGIVKRDLSDSPVRITPYVSDAEALADAGADVVAFDATDRVRPAGIEELVRAVKAKGKLTMADCSSLEDATQALAAGVDFVGTTLSGYVGGPEPVDPDIDLVAAMRRLTPYVIAEGRIRSPEQAAAAVKAGAYAVVVGSAITRTEHVTAWFHEALAKAYTRQDGRSAETVLAVDIGGTKTMAALVKGTVIADEILVPTAREAGPDAWLEAVAERTAQWRGRYARIGFAVTGLVQDGRWSALNPATLGIPHGYPLVDRATRLFGKPVFAMNDAQAAAWGEYKFGAGSGENLVFLTISTGIGGGIVINGRPLPGLAGHFGLIRGPSQGRSPLEDETSGRWITVEALKAGHEAEAAKVFENARQGAPWARAIVSQSALRAATLCRDIQLMLDPNQIVIGGGVGLAAGYIDEMREHLKDVAPRLAPRLVAAKLGGRAGIIGVADLAGEGG